MIHNNYLCWDNKSASCTLINNESIKVEDSEK